MEVEDWLQICFYSTYKYKVLNRGQHILDFLHLSDAFLTGKCGAGLGGGRPLLPTELAGIVTGQWSYYLTSSAFLLRPDRAEYD
jgi:hypothetical protein